MKLIDLHCDTIWKLMDLHGEPCVNIGKLKAANSLAQFFACFFYSKSGDYAGGYNKICDMINFGKEYVSFNAEHVALAYNKTDILSNSEADKISILLTVEEGGVLEGDIQRLNELYHKGIRLLTLLWNHENCIGYPNSKESITMSRGLKSFGVEVVRRMNELGMIIDVSHMSDGGFWDVVRYSKKPFIASHSNARALCNHPRNLSDDMIRAIGSKGGVIGVNFYPYFINGNSTATLSELMSHIKHIINVGGENIVSIGTDFDGFDNAQFEIKDIGEMYKLYDHLEKERFSPSLIDKICRENILTVLEEI